MPSSRLAELDSGTDNPLASGSSHGEPSIPLLIRSVMTLRAADGSALV